MTPDDPTPDELHELERLIEELDEEHLGRLGLLEAREWDAATGA